MRSRIAFPLTEKQQEVFDSWVRLVWRVQYAAAGEFVAHFNLSNADVNSSCRLAERDVAEAVLREPTEHQFGSPYWATDGCRERHHFCSQPTLSQGWYTCMNCWTD